MAEILIKGMQMPRGDDSIMIVIESDGSVWQRIGTTAYFCTGFKAVELPEHGDLKDANAILRWLNAKADNRVPVTVGEIIDFIEKQPTVVEATE